MAESELRGGSRPFYEEDRWVGPDPDPEGYWRNRDIYKRQEMPALPPNPKAKFGAQKPNLALIPGSANVAEALALEDGAKKYDPFNWRVTAVEAMTYVAAIRRHLDAWVDGDELTTDTGVPNLGALRASCSILIDAQASGTLIDNRPKATGASARLQDEVKASRAK